MPQLQSDLLALRAVEPEDLSLFYRWENNTAWWEQGNSINPYSKFVLRQYIEQSHKDIYQSRQLRLMIELPTGETIGTIDLYDYDPQHNRVGIGILIDSQYQQKGYALESLRLIEGYAIFLGIRNIYAHVNENNLPSKALFLKAGFRHTAVLERWLRVGDSYANVCVYQKII